MKDELRATLRARRKALDANTRAAAQDAVAEHLEALLGDVSIVAAYAAHGSELDLTTFVRRTRRRVAWPRVAMDGLVFAECGLDALVAGYRGLREPPAHAPVVHVDVILVPGLGFDRHGHRLGQGGGFYDRLLASLRLAEAAPLAVGVAFEVQVLETLAVDPWDQPVDALVSERGSLLIRRAP